MWGMTACAAGFALAATGDELAAIGSDCATVVPPPRASTHAATEIAAPAAARMKTRMIDIEGCAGGKRAGYSVFSSAAASERYPISRTTPCACCVTIVTPVGAAPMPPER